MSRVQRRVMWGAAIVFLLLVAGLLSPWPGPAGLHRPTAAHAQSENLISNPGFENGADDWLLGSYNSDPALDDGTEEIVSEGCRNGRCLKMTHHNSTWQGASQAVGRLEPAKTYMLRAWFKTSVTHYGHINLRDSSWRNQECKLVGLSNTRLRQGSGDWQELVQVLRVPEADPCGPLVDHEWRVYLYSYSPVEDPSPVWYDDVSLVEVEEWDLTDLEDDPLLPTVKCVTYTDGYPLTKCHEGVVERTEAEGRSTEEPQLPISKRAASDAQASSGISPLVLLGTREKQETVDIDIPVRPRTLYRIDVDLSIRDRRMFPYLDLEYPQTWTRQRPGIRDVVDLTKGLWSGLYRVQVDGVNILPPIIKDSEYRSPSDVDWFHESAYFETRPDQLMANVRVRLSGFDGKLLVDSLSVTPSESYIDEDYLHVPIEREFQGMKIVSVSNQPLAVETNSARFEFSSQEVEIRHDGVAVGHVRFDRNALAGLAPAREVGNVFMENELLALSVGADSVMVVTLKAPMKVSVSGPRPGFVSFDAGVLFVTDYERGVLFSPLRPPLSVRRMPSHFDPVLRVTNYDDSDFEQRGLKFWDVVSGFDEPAWQIDYEFAAGTGFVAQAFPPKEFDERKYCTERMHTIGTNTVLHPEGDFGYDLQRAGANINVGLVWMSSYAESKNDLDPPQEYCLNADREPVYCGSGEVASRHPVGTRFDVTGPYDVAEPEAFRKLIADAHARGMRVIVYMSPQYYYTSDVEVFLADLAEMIDEFDIDGVYYDGLYDARPLKSLELVRKTRNLLGDRFYAQHSSWVNTLIRRSHRLRVPFLDAQADVIWLGEGVKVVDDDTWRLNFCGRNVGNTASLLLSELRPVDWTADQETSVSLTLSAAEQISKTLACRGLFRTGPYSEISTIHDKHFQTSIPFESSLFLKPYNAWCAQRTCPDGRCDVGESIFNCPDDCAPVDPGAAVVRRGERLTCDLGGGDGGNGAASEDGVGGWHGVAGRDGVTSEHGVGGRGVDQWLLDGDPLFLLHYTFDAAVAGDVSGHEQHPHQSFGVTRRAPRATVADGRGVHVFDGSSYLFGEAGPLLQLTGRPFSAFLALQAHEGGEPRQVALGLNPGTNLQLGLEDGIPTVWVADGDKEYGVERIVSEGCFAGKCVVAWRNDASWQAISQSVGQLTPGATYELASMFRSAPSHSAYINLHDRDWKNADCKRTGRSFTNSPQPGSDEWQRVEVKAAIPMVDACGESTADHLWGVYLYTYVPVDDRGPIYYDEASLVRTEEPDVELIANGGFEEGFEKWSHSSYIAPDTFAAQEGIVDGDWHTMGITYDPPLLRLYVDGEAVDSGDISLRAFPRIGRYTIGSYSAAGNSQNFTGLLDDLIITRGALTQQQVQDYQQDLLRSLAYPGQAECVFEREGQVRRATERSAIFLPAVYRYAIRATGETVASGEGSVVSTGAR